MIRDVRWQLMKVCSFFVRQPPLPSFTVGEPIVDDDGHSLLGGPLIPDSAMAFEPCEPDIRFEGCDHYEVDWYGCGVIQIAVRDESVQAAFYDLDLYRESGVRRMRKLRHFLRAHSETDRLKEYVDNGSAILYTSVGRKQFGAYAYLSDTFFVHSTATNLIKTARAAT